jgi:hypothetical protein
MRSTNTHARALPVPMALPGINQHYETENRMVWNDENHTSEQHGEGLSYLGANPSRVAEKFFMVSEHDSVFAVLALVVHVKTNRVKTAHGRVPKDSFRHA